MWCKSIQEHFDFHIRVAYNNRTIFFIGEQSIEYRYRVSTIEYSVSVPNIDTIQYRVSKIEISIPLKVSGLSIEYSVSGIETESIDTYPVSIVSFEH